MKKLLISLVFICLTACATTNDSVVTGRGFPPEIVNVYFEPEKPILTDSVYLVINYKDLDGDVVNANLYYVITAPAGYSYMRVVYDGLLAKPETAGLIKGQKDGQAKIFLGSKWYGEPTLVVKLYLVDAAGNKSAAIKRKVDILPSKK